MTALEVLLDEVELLIEDRVRQGLPERLGDEAAAARVAALLDRMPVVASQLATGDRGSA